METEKYKGSNFRRGYQTGYEEGKKEILSGGRMKHYVETQHHSIHITCKTCLKMVSALASADQKQILAVEKAREEGYERERDAHEGFKKILPSMLEEAREEGRTAEFNCKECAANFELSVVLAKREVLEEMKKGIEENYFPLCHCNNLEQGKSFFLSLLTSKLEKLK